MSVIKSFNNNSFAGNLPKWHQAKFVSLINNLSLAQRTLFRGRKGENFCIAVLNAENAGIR